MSAPRSKATNDSLIKGPTTVIPVDSKEGVEVMVLEEAEVEEAEEDPVISSALTVTAAITLKIDAGTRCKASLLPLAMPPPQQPSPLSSVQ